MYLADESTVGGKMESAQCKEVMGRSQNLLPGRECSEGLMCKSSRCDEGLCVGIKLDANCSQHSDCETGTYCHNTNTWPFMSVCTSLLPENTECEEDAQCGIDAYCWYKSKEDKQGKTKKGV